MTQKISKESTN